MPTFRVLSAFAAAAMACGLCASTAAAATVEPTASSANWAGYVAESDASSGSDEQFSKVSASWVQPTANCSSGQGSSAFWVGLGGADGGSNALEQAGTEADCSSSGSPSYFAWYELLPAAPVRLGVAVQPGDHISTAVSVNASAVTITLTDNTTGSSATKNLQMDNPDVSSAEWIAEAPSDCDGSGDCQPLSLADFGSVAFTNASATANGHTGTISDPAWSAEATLLNGGGISAAGFGGFGGGQSTAGAAPSSLSSDGSSFSVAWQSASSQAGSAGSTDPGAGAGGAYPGAGGYGLGGGGTSGGYGSDPGYGAGGSYGGGPGGSYGYGGGTGGYGGGTGGYGGGTGGYGGGTGGYGGGTGGYGGSPYAYGGGTGGYGGGTGGYGGGTGGYSGSPYAYDGGTDGYGGDPSGSSGGSYGYGGSTYGYAGGAGGYGSYGYGD